jgi:hypothetical protein
MRRTGVKTVFSGARAVALAVSPGRSAGGGYHVPLNYTPT